MVSATHYYYYFAAMAVIFFVCEDVKNFLLIVDLYEHMTFRSLTVMVSSSGVALISTAIKGIFVMCIYSYLARK